VRTGLLLAGLLLAGGGVSLPAQQHTAPFIRWEPSATAPEPTKSWGTSEGKSAALGDYRYEGLAFGGVVFGALGVWMGSQISGACALEPGVPCPSNKTEQAVALGLVGAAVGGGLGYLVGRLSPKRPPPIETELPALDLVSVPDSVRKRTGYQHWRGAAIGLAIGGAVGALTGAVGGAVGRCDDCGQQPSAGSGALTVGLLGAGAGGVLGFLAGLSSPKYVWIPRVAQ
jgi:hypothetical protein